MINIEKLYRDYHIRYWTSGKNVAQGWINTQCPFCDDHSNHLGFSPTGVYVCWRCGPHPTRKALAKILRMQEEEIGRIVYQYGGTTRRREVPEEAVRIGDRKFKFPNMTEPMSRRHRIYLINRKFDPERLEAEWGLLGTGPVSYLDNIDFRHRIIAPIYWDNQIVSFQGRDFTEKSDLRYITCPKNRELVNHKRILYGKQEKWERSGICVEGITDVWRFGPRAFATFGIEYTPAQVHQIRKNFRRVFVIFDDEPQAVEQAEKLAVELRFHGINAQRIPIVGDPGGMDQSDADHLIKELL